MYSQNGKFIPSDKNLLKLDGISDINNSYTGNYIINSSNFNSLTSTFTSSHDFSFTNYVLSNVKVSLNFYKINDVTTFTFTAHNINGESNHPNTQELNIYRDKASIDNDLLDKRYVSLIQDDLSYESQSTTEFNNNADLSDTELILYQGYYDGRNSAYQENNFNNINPGIIRYRVSSVIGNFRYATFIIYDSQVVDKETYKITFTDVTNSVSIDHPDITLYIYFSGLSQNKIGWYNLKLAYTNNVRPGGGIRNIYTYNSITFGTVERPSIFQNVYLRIGINQGTNFIFKNITTEVVNN
tara:strand:- start:2175 stop:3068 length:894 start_codon:yes stop_codon:yes gene_type:complete